MFGSKLRSWMETHIVRPRKKGNKHKQSEGRADGISNGKKAGTLPQPQGCKSKSTTLPTSPVLVTNCGSHSGCSNGIASPVRRREVSPIQCHTPSRYGWQSPDQDAITSPKSDNLLYAPHRYQRQAASQNLQLSVPTSNTNTSAEKSPNGVHFSSSSMSSLSWSTGSKEPPNRLSNVASAKPAAFKPQIAEKPSVARIYDDDDGEVDYEEVGALLLRPAPPVVGHEFPSYQRERPQSENLAGLQLECDESSHVTYGRLLPSKLIVQVSESADNLTIKNEHLSMPSAGPGMGNPTCGRLRAACGPRRCNLRTTSQASMGMIGPPHSLSSPESAYSTGYSTDGTSPCAANYNPPEYYINMRTGTHYFPKTVNSLAIEAQRYKILDRIEEMSPLDPMPKCNFGNAIGNPFGQQSRLDPTPTPSPLGMHHAAPKIYESSPSPRQRCRIRTNPWYSTTECAFGTSGLLVSNSLMATAATGDEGMKSKSMRMELDTTSTTSTTSSGIKSSNDLEGLAVIVLDYNKPLSVMNNLAKAYESSEGSSSSTEVENLHVRLRSPHTIRRKHLTLLGSAASEQTVCAKSINREIIPRQVVSESEHLLKHQSTVFVASDDEATLNEMIGKFDESYVYEKETDILSSDSDPTDCPSELDTGQDAGDECDTDELLDIDFIDTSSMQEVTFEYKDLQQNLGSCSYFTSNSSPIRKASTRSRRNLGSFKGAKDAQLQLHTQPQTQPGGIATAVLQRRRKRFMKTRKKSYENRDKLPQSPLRCSRESRSVGGTPVCLRRNPLAARERIYKTSPLSNRSNSLIFGSINEKPFMTIAESEKALLQADMEADIKYRQLIMEAESLLESMKNSLQSIPRDTPVASPRRLNPLANKRVEMLKNSEVESKKQAVPPAPKESSPDNELAAAINKRIELLKLETVSVPSSPKLGRCSPRKTHLTNFMNQNVPSELQSRKVAAEQNHKAPSSPQLQLNGRRLQGSPVGSPRSARRMQSLSLRNAAMRQAVPTNLNGSDSEIECMEDVDNQRFLQQQAEPNYNSADYPDATNAGGQTNLQAGYYCPHSEPLKRKVYKGSSTFERIKKTFDLALDMGQQTKVHGFPSERQLTNLITAPVKSSMRDVNGEADELALSSNRKQQLLLSTIVDLKRSLEHQSYELSGFKAD